MIYFLDALVFSRMIYFLGAAFLGSDFFSAGLALVAALGVVVVVGFWGIAGVGVLRLSSSHPPLPSLRKAPAWLHTTMMRNMRIIMVGKKGTVVS